MNTLIKFFSCLLITLTLSGCSLTAEEWDAIARGLDEGFKQTNSGMYNQQQSTINQYYPGNSCTRSCDEIYDSCFNVANDGTDYGDNRIVQCKRERHSCKQRC
ncbi:hypothetical protein [Pseudoalteromonas phenolica]|uniref:hypothetical protein n=1 Tax=Pseudoalteromonas phenolica TaxID=161398 RepID=UPI0038516EC6